MKDRVKIEVLGTQTYTLNLLNRQKVAVYKAVSSDNTVCFEVDGKDLQKTKVLFDKGGRRYRIVKRSGALFTLKKAARKLGLMVGLLAVILSFIAYTGLVYDVEFAGDKVDYTAAMAILKEEGVEFPMYRPMYDKKKLEVALLKLDKVSSATVKRVGNRLTITFLTELTPPPVVDMRDPIPVISKCNAVVTRLVVMSGTALVKPGDTVKLGDTLIGAYLLVGEKAEEVPVRAYGDVYGKVYHGKKLMYPDTIMTTSRTGKEKTVVEIRLFGISTQIVAPFKTYETETRIVRGSPILPIEYIYHTFYETEFVAVPFSFEKEKELLIKEGFSELEKALPTGAKVLDRFYNIKRVDNSTVLELYYETEELLSEG